jgi:hypothetical protein
VPIPASYFVGPTLEAFLGVIVDLREEHSLLQEGKTALLLVFVEQIFRPYCQLGCDLEMAHNFRIVETIIHLLYLLLRFLMNACSGLEWGS